ncbi:MAG: hypothetical protein LBC58_07230 [Clostridiales Family XIII bacterium]|jgi:hypothetical protein|nr:hypothetical protein [Clostridiales Family XIII bacterium]
MSENNFDPITGAPIESTPPLYGSTPNPAPPLYGSTPNPAPPLYGANPNPAPLQYGPNPYAEAPPEVRKWNWGAFYFGWVWGVGNKAYLGLLTLIPCFGFIWMFVCGALGNQWAWKSGEFKDVEQFMAVQRTWNRAGLIAFFVSLAVGILVAILWGVIFAAAVNNLSYYTDSYYGW